MVELDSGCVTQLKGIYAALLSHQGRTGRLPHHLGDMFPSALGDPGVLGCPCDPGKGESGSDEERLDPRLPCSYDYQFADAPAQSAGLTKRTWKMEQLRTIGPRVPILRCWNHTQSDGVIINLSYGGIIYPTPPIWEDELERMGDGLPVRRPGKSLTVPWRLHIAWWLAGTC